MKIAVACMGSKISEHFGHCESFGIYDCENGEIRSIENVKNPGHKPGFLPNFLADRGVELIIAGGMGGGAVEIFNERGVQTVVGAAGEAEAAVKACMRGELKSTCAVCREHEHAHECGGHKH